MPAGRPSLYTEKLCDEICSQIVMGYSLRTICKEESMPSVATIFCWFRSHPEFQERYTKAKEEQADAFAEEMMDIADDASNDWMERNGKDGAPIIALNAEHVNRSRLRIDTRKWIAAKLKPKKYGERIQQDVSGTLSLESLVKTSIDPAKD